MEVTSQRSEGKVNGYYKPELPAGVQVEEIEIPVPWGQVSAKWWGPRNKQPIIAIHGWQDNAGTWDNLIPLLPVNTAFLCVDLPGHGRSSHYPQGLNYYIFWDGISLIRRIVRHFGWSKMTLMGHSLGAALCFMYAACYPDDVDRYIQLDTASPAIRDIKFMVKASGGSVDKLLHYENLTEDTMPCYEYDEMLDIVYNAYKGSVTKENCKVLMQRGMSFKPPYLHTEGYKFNRDIRLKVSAIGMISIEQAMEYAKEIKCKVLNFKSLPGRSWERLDYYELILDKLRERVEVEHYKIEGTHHVHLNYPEKIADKITDFIQSVELIW